jgi:hypothetical protein
VNPSGQLTFLWGGKHDPVPGLVQVYLGAGLVLLMAPLSSGGWWLSQPMDRGNWARSTVW